MTPHESFKIILENSMLIEWSNVTNSAQLIQDTIHGVFHDGDKIVVIHNKYNLVMFSRLTTLAASLQ